MRRRRPPGGFALISVLWLLGVLALLGTMLAATARQQAQRVANLRDAAAVEMAADAALHQAIFALLDPSERRWLPDGVWRRLRIGAVAVELRLEDEGGKVNPNIASAELLQALLRRIGLDEGRAAALAGAILDWRGVSQGPTPSAAKAARYAAAGRDDAPPEAPFESLEELGAVLGMTPEILARLRPHLTLHTTTAPDPAAAGPVVAAALGLARPPAARPAPPPDASRLVTVHVVARGPGGAAFAERSLVRTNLRPDIRRHEILAREPLPAPPRGITPPAGTPG